MRVLEDDPAFDAGVGSVLTEEGEVEMDAIIVDGKSLEFGAVACVNNIQNAVSLARLVMEDTQVQLHQSPPLLLVPSVFVVVPLLLLLPAL